MSRYASTRQLYFSSAKPRPAGTHMHFSRRRVCVCSAVLTMYFHWPLVARARWGRAYLMMDGHSCASSPGSWLSRSCGVSEG